MINVSPTNNSGFEEQGNRLLDINASITYVNHLLLQGNNTTFWIDSADTKQAIKQKGKDERK